MSETVYEQMMRERELGAVVPGEVVQRQEEPTIPPPPVDPPAPPDTGGSGDDEGKRPMVLNPYRIYAGIREYARFEQYDHAGMSPSPEVIVAFINGYNNISNEDAKELYESHLNRE